jgi:hypothetical protein
MSTAEKIEEPRPKIVWDTCEIHQNQADHLREEDPELSEDEALDRAYNDEDLLEHEFEYITDYLTEILKEMNPDQKPLLVSIDDFGWQNSSGRCVLAGDDVHDGKKFLRKVLPDTDCMYHIFVDQEKSQMRINNWHHDSPMGESYYITILEDDDLDD